MSNLREKVNFVTFPRLFHAKFLQSCWLSRCNFPSISVHESCQLLAEGQKMKSICYTRRFNIFISLNILLEDESVDASRAIRHSNQPASALHSRKIRSRTSYCRCRCNESLRLLTRSLNPPWNIRYWNIRRLQQRRQSCSKTHFQLKVASEPRGIVWIAFAGTFSAIEERCWE